MLKQVTELHLAKSNNDFKTIRVSIKGWNPTGAEDFVEIPNLQSVSTKTNTETASHFFFGDEGQSTSKKSNAPSTDIEFIYSGAEVQDYLIQTGWKTGQDGCTQIEAISFTGEVVSYIANVIVDNFGIDGAPGDDAVVKISLPYAGGPIEFSNEDEEVVEGE